jgi:ADP-heptose:LPS heptosyltransferase
MQVKTQRAIDFLVGVPICAVLSLLNRVLPQRKPRNPPQRILIILLSEMGSLVLAYPMMMRLKERYPEASLHFLMFGRNHEMLDLLGAIPAENILTLDDRSLFGLLRDSAAVITQFWRLKFDVVIDCELFARISAIFAFLTRAPVHAGFQPHTQEGLYRGSFISRPVLYNTYRHLSQQLLSLVDAIDTPVTGLTHPLGKRLPIAYHGPEPRFRPRPGELAAEAEQLHRDFPQLRGRRLVLLHPGGGALPIRAWPMESYMALCTTLLAQGYAVAVVGLKEDKPLGARMLAHCKHELCIDLTGYTRSVRHLLTVFERADLLVTNDGGPGHFAALTDIATLIFFGPETPVLYRSLARNAAFFHTALPCSPCLTAYNHRNSPCDGDNQCLKQITPDVVEAKCREVLAVVPTSGRPELVAA